MLATIIDQMFLHSPLSWLAIEYDQLLSGGVLNGMFCFTSFLVLHTKLYQYTCFSLYTITYKVSCN